MSSVLLILGALQASFSMTPTLLKLPALTAVVAFVLLSDRFLFIKGHPKLVPLLCLIAVPLFLTLLTLWNIGEPLVQSLGRDGTFTGRTQI